MPKASAPKTLTDAQIRTGTLVTKPTVDLVNKVNSTVKAAVAAGKKDVTLSVADMSKISVLLKSTLLSAKASDGTDFHRNDTDPGDAVRVGD
jgi:hypothetical protein